MSTSGTAAFNLELTDLIEEAFERCGSELRSGYHFTTARRSLNLLTIEWANRGINLWSIEEGLIPLAQGQAVYALPADTIDILESAVRTASGGVTTDMRLARTSATTYAGITNKASQGRPTQVWVDRQTHADPPAGPPSLRPLRAVLWPVPDGAQMALVYWRMRRTQDVADGSNTVDIPFRFLEALTAGLAYKLAAKLPGVDPNRAQFLKAEYEEQFQRAAEEDREKADLHITPRIGR